MTIEEFRSNWANIIPHDPEPLMADLASVVQSAVEAEKEACAKVLDAMKDAAREEALRTDASPDRSERARAITATAVLLNAATAIRARKEGK